jgi:hypothetical protein
MGARPAEWAFAADPLTAYPNMFAQLVVFGGKVVAISGLVAVVS